ncbi:MYXO-CTERM sorting domain-containing protein [Enhygromyxa salina]|uniref:MYXO-CTERM sorting domain-containing protein n=1 Tax=Enhygromyxa salina TaxID=215803 RepID=UPI0011BA77DD|nr:MYXO-CTERM sorting domain-containing protein [Enhygromyxa salina]
MSGHKSVVTPSTSLIPALLAACLSLGVSSVAAAAPPAADARDAPVGSSSGGAGPEEEACAGRSVGDACSLPNRQLGTCTAGTCNRLDYSGGSPPKAIEEACVVCQPGAGDPGHGGPPSLGSGGAPPDSGDGGDASESTPADTGKEPPKSSSRCRVTPDAGGPGALGLLGILGLLGVTLRRRRQPGS